MKSGKLLATEGCLPSALGARVRLSGGKFNVIDGPFTEAKELVAGFALLQAETKDEAIEFIKEFLKVAGDGETEMRQIFEPGMDFTHLNGEVPEATLQNTGETSMRFMMLMIPKGYENAEPGAMPSAEAVAAMMKYNESLQKAGVLLALDGLHPPSMGARVTFPAANQRSPTGPSPKPRKYSAATG